MKRHGSKLFIACVLAATILLGLAIATVASGGTWLPPALYGTQYTFYFEVYDSNSPWRVYETAPAAADIHVFQDGASEANPANAVTDIGRTFSLVLSAAEMTARVVTVDINDATEPPAFGDQVFYIPTYGNASAYMIGNMDNLDIAVSDVNSVLQEFYDYSVEVNETYIENIYDKNTTIQNYITEMNETYVENIFDTTTNTYSYLTDVNETYIENIYDNTVTTYNYMTDMNETFITNIYNDVNDIAVGDLSLIVDANDLMDAIITDHRTTENSLGKVWWDTLHKFTRP